MKIVIIVAGTEGDARPNVALGIGLAHAGHDVTVLTSRDFEPLCHAAGLKFAPLTADFRQMMQADRKKFDGKPAIATALYGLARLREMARGWIDDAVPVVECSELIIGSGGALYFASVLAEAFRVPFVRTMFNPQEPTREIPPVLFPPPPFRIPGRVNLLLYGAMRALGWQFGRPIIARLRSELGVAPPPWRGPWQSPWLGRAPILNGFSRHIVEPPRDWGRHIATTGFWIVDSKTRAPSEELREFLDEGPAPIYVGFGSMVMRDPAGFASMIAESLRLAGCRAIILAGWGGLTPHLGTHTGILMLDYAPHEWLLPRVQLAVHHCGAGTAAAVARAGIPSVPVPFLFDQFFWAKRLHGLGVATPPLGRKRMTAGKLAEAIVAAQHLSMREAARRLGERLRAEDGVANALAALRTWRLIPEPS